MKGIYFLLFFLLLNFYSEAQQLSLKIKTVVIDPGHGGKDPGAIGKNSREKDIVLSVGTILGETIKKNFPDINVIYTRDDDTFISLNQRADIANKNSADLFISIHCNSATATNAYGAETFVMGLHKTEANLAVAKKENAAIFLENDYQDNYEGFNPNSDEDYIALSLFQGAFMDQSLRFANSVQTRFTSDLHRHDRGVKPAGFWVLYKTACPGILAELGFISNLKEEAFLLSTTGQNKMAMAIYHAFVDYKSDYELMNQQPVPVAITLEPEPEEPQIPTIPTIPNTKEKCFFVQLISSSKPKNLEDFERKDQIYSFQIEENYRYYCGIYSSLSEASKAKKQLRKEGFKDAFVVAFKDGKKVSIK